MTREEFYKTKEIMEEAKDVVRALEILDFHLFEATTDCCCNENDRRTRDNSDFAHMIQGMFVSEKLVSVFLKQYYCDLDNLLIHGEIGDKNLLETVKKRSLETFTPEEMFVARDKFLNNLKKAFEKILAAIQLPKAEEKNKNCIDNDKNVK